MTSRLRLPLAAHRRDGDEAEGAADPLARSPRAHLAEDERGEHKEDDNLDVGEERRAHRGCRCDRYQ